MEGHFTSSMGGREEGRKGEEGGRSSGVERVQR